jgi:hypothetical protein
MMAAASPKARTDPTRAAFFKVNHVRDHIILKSHNLFPTRAILPPVACCVMRCVIARSSSNVRQTLTLHAVASHQPRQNERHTVCTAAVSTQTQTDAKITPLSCAKHASTPPSSTAGCHWPHRRTSGRPLSNSPHVKPDARDMREIRFHINVDYFKKNKEIISWASSGKCSIISHMIIIFLDYC